MKFSDFVAVDAIRSDIESDTKQGVIREMAEALVEAGKIAPGELEGIVKAIMKREDLGSTGIGRGVAVPHTKHPSVDRPGDHLRALENISRQLRDDGFCKRLKASQTPAEIEHLLEEADHHGFVS